MPNPNDTKNMKIVFSSQEKCDTFEKEMSEVLNVLGVRAAFVTDESTVSDFLVWVGQKKPSSRS